MSVKKTVSICSQVVFAIDKLEKVGYDRPALIESLNAKDLTSGFSVRDSFIAMLNKGLLLINQKENLSHEKLSEFLFGLDDGFFSINEIINEVIDLCSQVSSTIVLNYNDYETNLNPHSTQKIIHVSEDITQIYKDIIKALDAIELRISKQSLIKADAMMQAIENVEQDIDLLSEGIAIVKRQRKFTYYDIVLIMTRFHCGLTRLLYIIRDIRDAIDILNDAIENIQKRELKENNDLGSKK